LAETAPVLPGELREGRRALEPIAGFESLGSFQWNAAVERWVLPCRLSLEEPGPWVPADSRWYRRDKLFSACRASYPLETGGVLIGRYNRSRDLAQILSVTQPPRDSRRGRTWFERGTAGLARALERLWSRPGTSRLYYLGEWHSHPDAAPTPSRTDCRQMEEIANQESYRCPEPVLLIVGGNSEVGWRIAVWVFPRGQPPVELLPDLPAEG
jgi:integrative and conjugative element protein (TIGR02256 family)